MKGDRRRLALQAVHFIADYSGGLVLDLFCVLEAMLAAGAHASRSKLEYELRKARRTIDSAGIPQERKQGYHNLIYKLKRDGLVQPRAGKLALTRTGHQSLKNFQERARIDLPERHYSGRPAANLIIVAFDVPEQERRKRDWLREVLKNLKLKMIQKSVWIGKVKIPQELLEDLQALGLTNFVEIFEVSKTGTLRSLS